jgi:hypothetical protein
MRPSDYWPYTRQFTPDFLMRISRRIFAHLSTCHLPTFREEHLRLLYPSHILVAPSSEHNPPNSPANSETETESETSRENTQSTGNGTPTAPPNTPIRAQKRPSVQPLDLETADQPTATPQESDTSSTTSQSTTSESPEHTDTPKGTPHNPTLEEMDQYSDELLQVLEKTAVDPSFLPALTPEFLQSFSLDHFPPTPPIVPEIPVQGSSDSTIVGNGDMTVADMHLMKVMGETAQFSRMKAKPDNSKRARYTVQWKQQNLYVTKINP